MNNMYMILHVCAFRMKRRSGVVFRQTSRRLWSSRMISRWKLNRSCAHSGGSCRRSRIVMQSFLQTLRPCRESGTIFPIFFSSSPSTSFPFFSIGLQFFSPCTNVVMIYLPESCHISYYLCFIHA